MIRDAPTNDGSQSRSRRNTRRAPWLVLGALLSCIAATGILAAVVGVSMLGPQVGQLVSPPTTTASSRSVVQISSSLSEKWRLTDLVLPNGPMPSGLLAVGDRVVFVALEARTGTVKLQAVNEETGTLFWEQPGVGIVDSFYADSERIYLAYDSRVSAYSLAEGERQWLTERFPSHTSYIITPFLPGELEILSIDDTGGKWTQVVRHLNSTTGDIISTTVIEGERGALLQIEAPDMRIWGNESDLWMTRTTAPASFWRTEFPGPILRLAISDSMLVLTIGGAQPEAVGVDSDDGSIVWSVQGRFVSPPVLSEHAWLLLRDDGLLVSVDLSTGKVSDEVRFTPAPDAAAVGSFAYWTAYSDRMVFVYLGDSRELFAFERTDPTVP